VKDIVNDSLLEQVEDENWEETT